MPSDHTYGQFCPLARATEIVAERWTPLVLRELLLGSHRFSEIHEGMPRMSPSLLSQRLRKLVALGIVERHDDEDGRPSYDLTEAGRELEPVIMSLGHWGQRWIGDIEPRHLDPVVLMKDIRRRVRPEDLPDQRVVVGFHFADAVEELRDWWLVLDPTGPDVCDDDPGYDVDLWVGATLRTLTRIWIGHDTLRGALADGRVSLNGPRDLRSRLAAWLGLSLFASVQRATTPLKTATPARA